MVALEKIVVINNNNFHLISEFIENAGDSLQTFRYFKNRSLDSVNNHLHTCVLTIDNVSLGYGHLDYENGIVWLGIALSQHSTGQGFGKKIMSHLIKIAITKKIKNIQLSVDISNHSAISLYKSLDFNFLEKNKNYYVMKKNILS